MVHFFKRTACIGLSVLILAACAGESQKAPNLMAPPTRTPAPATPVAEDAETTQAAIEVITLGEAIDQFLAQSAETSPLDQAITFIQVVGGNAPTCLNQDQYDQFLDVAALHFPLMDLTAWQASAQSFPAAALEQAVTAAAADVPELMPSDGSTVRVCLLPMPFIDLTNNEMAAQARRTLPHMGAMADLNAVAIDGATVLVFCAAGEDCLDDVPVQLPRAFGLAYQLRAAGLSLRDLPLLSRLINEGRADDFLLRRDPTLHFAWDAALTPEGEGAFWQQFRHLLADDDTFASTYSLTSIVYGAAPANSPYPAWGGVYVGDQIVRAYLDKFPDTTWTDLAALDPVNLLADSGYGPASEQTRLVE